GARVIRAGKGVAELHCIRAAADVVRPRAQQLVAARQLHVARLARRSQLLGRLKPAATFDPVDLVEDQRRRLANRWTGLRQREDAARGAPGLVESHAAEVEVRAEQIGLRESALVAGLPIEVAQAMDALRGVR